MIAARLLSYNRKVVYLKLKETVLQGRSSVPSQAMPTVGLVAGRIVNVRTVWAFDEPNAPPRLVNAYPKP
jgi:hypothetical protein